MVYRGKADPASQVKDSSWQVAVRPRVGESASRAGESDEGADLRRCCVGQGRYHCGEGPRVL